MAIKNSLKIFGLGKKALDPYIHFTFVTGVTKFAKTSLFSGATNLDDVSLSEKFSSICGYTEEEIINNVKEYIADFATTTHSSGSDN